MTKLTHEYKRATPEKVSVPQAYLHNYGQYSIIVDAQRGYCCEPDLAKVPWIRCVRCSVVHSPPLLTLSDWIDLQQCLISIKSEQLYETEAHREQSDTVSSEDQIQVDEKQWETIGVIRELSEEDSTHRGSAVNSWTTAQPRLTVNDMQDGVCVGQTNYRQDQLNGKPE